MTSLGLVFIPLCLLFWNRPARLLELVFIGSAFAAAAVLVIGSYGVMPGLIPTSMFVAYIIIKLLTGTRYPGEKTALIILLPFIATTFWAMASSILMPRFFEGQILVWPQKPGGFFVITPLSPNSGNLTQDLYLLAASALAVTATIYLTAPTRNLTRLLNAYFAANLLVCFIAVWQFMGNTFGVWFPTDFFLSNPGWALLSQESAGSIIRITGPFSEPAALASYLCGAVGAAGWVLLNGHKSVIARFVFWLSGIVVLLSTSTTGYIALVIMLAVASAYTLFLGTNRLRASVGLLLCGLAGAAFLFIILVPILSPKIWHIIQEITTGTLNKQSSSSYNDRTSTDKDSLHAAVESYGLGVGWGSNRSSSLIPGLLASLGFPGIFLLVWFGINLTRYVRIAHRLAKSPDPRLVMHAATGGIFGTLSAGVLSGPAITSPDFYLLLALLVAAATRVTVESRQTREASHATSDILSTPELGVG
jgi:hypothetical protein